MKDAPETLRVRNVNKLPFHRQLVLMGLLTLGGCQVASNNDQTEQFILPETPTAVSQTIFVVAPIKPLATLTPTETKRPLPTATLTPTAPIPTSIKEKAPTSTRLKATAIPSPKITSAPTREKSNLISPESEGKSIDTAISPNPEKNYQITPGFKFFYLNDPYTKAGMYADINSGKADFLIIDPDNFNNLATWFKEGLKNYPPKIGQANHDRNISHDVFWSGGNGGYEKRWVVMVWNHGPEIANINIKTWSKPASCAGKESFSYKEHLPNQKPGEDPINWGTCDEALRPSSK